ncbi:MAG: hypothetical protein N2Z20_05535 [Elusimicrobiales bacterium]|nr:hypothetical protein [Elusimicrobiales bacterium]
MSKYFGTDGIRGIPFKFPLTRSMIQKIGFAVSKVFKSSKRIAFLARDTRDSGEDIIKILANELVTKKIKVYNLGVLTTPALSYIISLKKPSFGIMVSASHNPPEYNGIKVFDSKGNKISPRKELEIEKIISLTNIINMKKNNTKYEINNVDFRKEYLDYVLNLFSGLRNDKYLAIDCSNGSASFIAPEVFSKLGFRYELIGSQPTGFNINVGCGSLDTKLLREVVLKNKCWCGISYDGDADRCIIISENGDIIDGDDLIMLFATYYLEKGILKNKTVVLTQMSNYGLVKYLENKGIKVIFVDVGDRNVIDAMKKYNSVVGGETSGHVILSRYLNTGDGIVTSLEFLKICNEISIKVSEVKKMWKRYPSVLKSFKVGEKIPFKKINGFLNYIKSQEKIINGRIFIRYSGTEPVLRILAEGNVLESKLNKLIDEIYKVYLDEIGKV